jgi:hypothetical protein
MSRCDKGYFAGREVFESRNGSAISVCIRSEVFTAVKIMIVVFWVMTLCNFIGDYQAFGWTYCFHLHGTIGSIWNVRRMYRKDGQWKRGTREILIGISVVPSQPEVLFGDHSSNSGFVINIFNWRRGWRLASLRWVLVLILKDRRPARTLFFRSAWHQKSLTLQQPRSAGVLSMNSSCERKFELYQGINHALN